VRLESALAWLIIGIFLIGLVAMGLDAVGILHLGHVINDTSGLGDR
jgi:hypothetical protein